MRGLARTGASVGVLLVAIAFLHLFRPGEAVPIRRPLETFPASLGQWQGRELTTLSEDVLQQLKLSDYVLRRYAHPEGQSVWLYVGYWDTQRRGAQIHSPKHCLPGGGWNPLEAESVRVPISSSAGAIAVNRYLLQKGASFLLVAYWFQMQGETIANELDAKIALVESSLLRNRSDAALVRVSAEVSGDPEKTWARLERYIQDLYPTLREFLPE
ncbi:MAG: exosortase C-terminal domain/associated protein EpsI [Candidatus Binatia bacterium]